MLYRQSPFTQQQYNLFTITSQVGIVTVFVVGIATCVLLTLCILWLLIQVTILILTSCIEALSQLSALYGSTDPLIKLIIIGVIGYGVYHMYRGMKNHD